MSLSPSSSTSPSSSISLSLSPSPSAGYSVYTRSNQTNLPTNDEDLDTPYTEAEEIRVTKRDKSYVSQTGVLQYMLHQYKVFVGDHTKCAVEWEGRSTLAPSESPVYLQIYNHSDSAWETIDTESEAKQDVNFELSKKITDLSDYVENKVISCRIYQLALE